MKIKSIIFTMLTVLLFTSNVNASENISVSIAHPLEKNINAQNYRLDPEISSLESQKLQAAKANYDKKLAYQKSNAFEQKGIYAASNSVSVPFHQQLEYYYCGPATALMIISSKIATTLKQQSLANDLGTTTSGTAWYLSNGNTYTQYPMYNTLKKYLGSMYNYVPSPTGVAGENPLSIDDIKYRVTFTIDQGYSLAFNGNSPSTGVGHLPNYPKEAVAHWAVANGYKFNGDIITLTDPASNYNYKFELVPPMYDVGIATIQAFLKPRGLLW